MICLIRNLTSVSQPLNGYDCLPPNSESTPGADLARIKYYRNYLAHHDSDEIDSTYFNKAWTDISDAIKRLGGQAMYQECLDLKLKTLDRTNQEIMLEIRSLKQSVEALQIMQEDPIPLNIRNQIKQELEAWKKNNEIFFNTRAAKHVLKCIKMQSCVTVTGSSGVGKTATVHHVALQMQGDGYNIIPIIELSDVIKFYTPQQKSLFVIDDFCGTFTINPTFLDKCKSVAERIKSILQEKKTKILVTCRLQVYQDEKFKAIPLFQSCECNLQSDKLCLLDTETQAIADMYLGTNAPKIYQHAELHNFSPLLCKLCKENPKLNISEFFQHPLSVYEEEIDKLYIEGAYGKYSALALCVIFNNNLKEEWLTDEVTKDIQTVIKNTIETCKMARGTNRLILKDELDSLLHTFIKKEEGVYKAIHDKIFDFLSFYFGNKMLLVLIRNATSRFIRERFLFERKDESDQLKIIVPERYKQKYIERMISDWSKGKVVDVFCNTNMDMIDFRQQFKSYLFSLDKSYQAELAHKHIVGNRSTVLIQSCFIGDMDMIQWCCHHGVDVNQCSNDGASPLYIACQEGHIEIVNMLLDKKADYNKCMNNGTSPLYIACQEGHKEIVNMLLDKKADYNKCTNDGRSPLFIACQEGHKEIVNMLLDKKADYNKCENNGASPLFVACYKGHIEIVNMLLDKKADYNECEDDGASPLYVACQEGHIEIVNMLLDKNADYNKCMNNGESPLFIACMNNHLQIVELLLRRGADYNICTTDGKSPLDIAREKGHQNIVTLLGKHYDTV